MTVTTVTLGLYYGCSYMFHLSGDDMTVGTTTDRVRLGHFSSSFFLEGREICTAHSEVVVAVVVGFSRTG